MNRDTDDDGFGITPPRHPYNLRTPRVRISPPTSTRANTNADRSRSPILDSCRLPSPGFSDNNSDTSAITLVKNVVNAAANAPVSDTSTVDYTENNATVRATDDNTLSGTLIPAPNPVTKTEPGSIGTLYKSENGLISPIYDPIYDATTDTTTATHDTVSDISSLNLSATDDIAHAATEVTVRDTPTPGQRPHITRKIRRFRPSPPCGSPPTKRFITSRTTRQRPLKIRPKPLKPLRFHPIPPRRSPTTSSQTQNTQHTGMIKTLIENFTTSIIQSNTALNKRFDEQKTANELRFLQMNQTLINNSGPLTAMLTPSFFSGDSSESVKQFLRSFITYANQLGWPQEKCLHTIPALLTKSAALWWDNLTLGKKPDTFDDFYPHSNKPLLYGSKKIQSTKSFQTTLSTPK